MRVIASAIRWERVGILRQYEWLALFFGIVLLGPQLIDERRAIGQSDQRNDVLDSRSTTNVDSAAKAPPNVLFILADDLGWGDLGCYGNQLIDTPAIDSLARRGARLTAHYSPSPLCAPARAAYLTGMFNHRTGAVDVPSNRGLDRIALNHKTFGDYFRQAGYTTALIGKWHNGLYCDEYLPHHRGFDLFYGYPNGGQDYWRWHLTENDHQVPHDGRYLCDALNERATEFIRRASERKLPFAMFLAHPTPHVPLQAPDALVAKYQERLPVGTNQAVAIVYAMIEAMDLGIGRVLQTLEELEIADNTLIVFTSDNGPSMARGGPDPTLGSQTRFNGGFSGQKQWCLEGGIRVPAVVCWPGEIPAGHVIDVPVHGCDWLPTLLSQIPMSEGAASNGVARHLDGQNIMPLLQSTGDTERFTKRFLNFQRNRYHPVAHSNAAVRWGKWKLHWPSVGVTNRKDSGRDNPSYLRGIQNPHWEMPLDRHLGSPPEFSEPSARLYDLESDPAEKTDVAAQYPEIVARMMDVHDRWFADVMQDWADSRAAILEHDQQYWKSRVAPEPEDLFREYWQWSRAPKGAARENPTEVFGGFWSNN